MSKKSKKHDRYVSPLVSEYPIQKTIKLLVIGDAGVGKTSLINKAVNNTFSENYISTVGIDFKQKIISISGRNVRLQIWDTAGQQRFHTITKAYYRGAHGLIVMFDITDPESFQNLQYWLENIQESCDKKHQKIIVGGKADLAEGKKVKMEKVTALCEQLELTYMEVSSKTGKNVEQTFEALAKMVLANSEEPKSFQKKKMTLEGKQSKLEENRKGCQC